MRPCHRGGIVCWSVIAIFLGSQTKETDMAKMIVSGVRKISASVAVLTIGLLAGSAGQAWAVGFSNSSGHIGGSAVELSRGPAFITGSVGSMQTTTLPGGAGQGLLMNNGNGTSTLLSPGGLPQVVATPR
jgi:hypothetical protein